MTPAAPEGILILGAPRSGTTLLRRLVDAHPNVACPSETNVFTACGRFLRRDRVAEGVRIGVVDGLAFAGFTSDDVLGRLRELAFSFHRDYAKAQEKRRWASKTAFDSFYIAEVEELCGGHVVFVCLLRHGLDVCCSLQDLSEHNGGYLSELHDYIRQYPMVLEAFAHAWVDLTDKIRSLAARYPQRAIIVKYEDLVGDPNATMMNIMAFLGETWDPAWTEGALRKREDLGLGDWKTYAQDAVYEASVGRWRRELSRNAVGRLATICNPTLASCGYETLEVAPERGDNESHRRYEVGLLVQKLAVTPTGGNQRRGD